MPVHVPRTAGPFPPAWFGEADSQSPSPVRTLAADRVWSWFNDPHVVYQHAGGTDWLHLGGATTAGDVVVTSVNLDTGETSNSNLHPALQVDDHSFASLLAMPDGTLFASYSKHAASGFWWRRTTNPADPTSWDTEHDVSAASLGLTDVAYPKPVLFASGRLFIIFRADGQSQKFVYSDNDGGSWSSLLPMIVNGTERPYVNLDYDAASDLADLIFTDGHPNPALNSLWHATLDSSGNMRKSDGTLIRNVISSGSIAPSEGTSIYPYAATTGKAWGWDVHRDGSTVRATFTRYPKDVPPTLSRFCYAEWNGTSWTVQPDVMGMTGGVSLYSAEVYYTGGLVLSRASPGELYTSRQDRGSNAWEIERWVRPAQALPAVVLASNPTAYYRLGEPSGTTATDETGTHNGTYVNAPTLGVAGALPFDSNTAARFSAASSQRVDLTTLGSLGSNLLTMTAEARIRPTNSTIGTVFGTVNTGTSLIVALHTNAIGAAGPVQTETAGATLWSIRFDATHWLQAHVTAANATVNVYDGNFHHVAVRMDSPTTCSIFFDGERQLLTYTSQDGVSAANFDFKMSVGARNVRDTTWDRYFTGDIDEVAFTARQLSDGEIRQNRDAGAGFAVAETLTSSSDQMNIRPVSPRNPGVLWGNGHPDVVWARGRYTSYVDYATDAVSPLFDFVSATVFTDSGSGTVTVSGTGTGARAYTDSRSGTIGVSGTGTAAHDHTRSGTATVTVSGTGIELYVPSGDSGTATITVSGSGTDSYTHAGSRSGTVTVSGSGTDQKTYTGAGSGTVTTSGTLTFTASHDGSGQGQVTLFGTGFDDYTGTLPPPRPNMPTTLGLDPHQRGVTLDA